MSAPLKATLDAALWRDDVSDPNFPGARPLLAHYTSVSTLEKVVTSGELWLSNPMFMNDFEELRFGMNAGAREFRTHSGLVEACGSAIAHATLVAEFDRLFSAFDSEHAMDTYVLCLSEHDRENEDGILSMWRGYGANGGGVALVFDSSKLPAVEDSPLVLGRVRYASGPDRLNWIDAKVNALAAVVDSIDKTAANLKLVAAAYLERLKAFALFTKHDGFSEEKEWRLVYSSERDTARLFTSRLGYSVTARGVVPKLRLNISELPLQIAQGLTLENIIDRVLLGPSISTVLAANSLRRMLTLARREALASKVVASSIPYRP